MPSADHSVKGHLICFRISLYYPTGLSRLCRFPSSQNELCLSWFILKMGEQSTDPWTTGWVGTVSRSVKRRGPPMSLPLWWRFYKWCLVSVFWSALSECGHCPGLWVGCLQLRESKSHSWGGTELMGCQRGPSRSRAAAPLSTKWVKCLLYFLFRTKDKFFLMSLFKLQL